MMVMQGGSMTRRLMLIASAATLLLASAPAMADYLVRRPGPLQPRDLAQGTGRTADSGGARAGVGVSIPSGLAARPLPAMLVMLRRYLVSLSKTLARHSKPRPAVIADYRSPGSGTVNRIGRWT